MRIDSIQVKSPRTTLALFVLFVIAMTAGMRVTNAETLAATLAYAAVLIEFVATSDS